MISKNLIIANRKELLNGNGFVMGVSGSGKSFTAKREIAGIVLSSEDDVIVIDPESEYSPLIEGLGGEVIEISATSSSHMEQMGGVGTTRQQVVMTAYQLKGKCKRLYSQAFQERMGMRDFNDSFSGRNSYFIVFAETS